MTLVSVYGSDYFDTTGIRIKDAFDIGNSGLKWLPPYEDVEILNGIYCMHSRKFIAVDEKKAQGKILIYRNSFIFIYDRHDHFSIEGVKFYLAHVENFKNKPEQYDPIFAKDLTLNTFDNNTFHIQEFSVPEIRGAEVILGNKIYSSSPDSYYAGADEAKKVYTSSYEYVFSVWFKTKEQIAKEINKQLNNWEQQG